jgi:hypothetical protein
MKHRILFLLPALLFLICGFVPVRAQEQEEEEITISLDRDFGYSLGSEIQGTFTIQVAGPPELSRVEFWIESQLLGEDRNPPFQIRFNTGNYEFGDHNLKAIGYTQDGRELHSQTLLVNFVSPDRGWQTAMTIVIPLLVLILGAVLLSAVFPFLFGQSKHKDLPLGAPRSYGLAGGTICPKCGRPFGMHLYGVNLLVGKFDRCPFCRRWSLVRRVSPHQLSEAEAAELQMTAEGSLPNTLSEEEKLRKNLDDSRYQDL